MSYTPPVATNVIIDLDPTASLGTYSPPSATNVIIDLGLTDVTTYTDYIFFLSDTCFF